MKTTQPTTNPIPRVPDRIRSDGWWLVSEPVARRLAAANPESVVVNATEDRADDYRQHHDSYRRADGK